MRSFCLLRHNSHHPRVMFAAASPTSTSSSTFVVRPTSTLCLTSVPPPPQFLHAPRVTLIPASTTLHSRHMVHGAPAVQV